MLTSRIKQLYCPVGLTSLLVTGIGLTGCSSINSKASSAPLQISTAAAFADYEKAAKDPAFGAMLAQVSQMTWAEAHAFDVATLPHQGFQLDTLTMADPSHDLAATAASAATMTTRYATIGAYWKSIGFQPTLKVTFDDLQSSIRTGQALDAAKVAVVVRSLFWHQTAEKSQTALSLTTGCTSDDDTVPTTEKGHLRLPGDHSCNQAGSAYEPEFVTVVNNYHTTVKVTCGDIKDSCRFFCFAQLNYYCNDSTTEISESVDNPL